MKNRCPEPTCQRFDQPVSDHYLVCAMCGTPLGTVNESQDSSTSEDRSPLPQPPNLNSSRPQLKLSHSSGKDFYLPGESGIVGRRDRHGGKVPEIDLTEIPHARIVTRSHAHLYWDKSQRTYMIVDDSSRNGSYLNGQELTPGSPYPLRHEDELQLGQNHLVCFRVTLV